MDVWYFPFLFDVMIPGGFELHFCNIALLSGVFKAKEVENPSREDLETVAGEVIRLCETACMILSSR